MYLRPDEVARVLEKAGFTMDVVTQKAYGYRRGDNYVYVNREARMGRTALIISKRNALAAFCVLAVYCSEDTDVNLASFQVE